MQRLSVLHVMTSRHLWSAALITQTQLSRAIIKENETTVTTRVNFTNPTKEFIIICKLSRILHYTSRIEVFAGLYLFSVL